MVKKKGNLKTEIELCKILEFWFVEKTEDKKPYKDYRDGYLDALSLKAHFI